jgi:hypothetical protein
VGVSRAFTGALVTLAALSPRELEATLLPGKLAEQTNTRKRINAKSTPRKNAQEQINANWRARVYSSPSLFREDRQRYRMRLYVCHVYLEKVWCRK